MKTRNNTTGRSNNQLSGVLLRSAAVVVSVVLLSFTVSAQNLWRELLSYNSFGKMAMLLVDESETGTSTSANFYVEEVNDEALEVESWMTSDAYFGANNSFNEVAQDEALEVESWMTNDAYFGAYNNLFQVEQDEELEVESWMTDENYFTSRYANDRDQELKVEVWMSDDNYWNN